MTTNLYDELDPLYRAIWGGSLHHGLWLTGHENAVEARRNLTEKVISALPPRGTIADIGCGYGTLARELVAQFPCHLIANTNARVQASQISAHPDLTIVPGNWLDHPLPDESLDAAFAIESLSHFPDFDQFLSHTGPALRPGGRLVVADWFSDSGDSFLLRHLAAVGQIPRWRSFPSLVAAASRRGLELVHSRDFSRQAAPTWTHLFGKALLLPLRKPALLPALVTKSLRFPGLFSAFPLIRLAYQCGHLQYRFVTLQK